VPRFAKRDAIFLAERHGFEKLKSWYDSQDRDAILRRIWNTI